MTARRSSWWPSGHKQPKPMVVFGQDEFTAREKRELRAQYQMYRDEMIERPDDWTEADRAEIRKSAARHGFGYLIPE